MVGDSRLHLTRSGHGERHCNCAPAARTAAATLKVSAKALDVATGGAVPVPMACRNRVVATDHHGWTPAPRCALDAVAPSAIGIVTLAWVEWEGCDFPAC